METVGDILYEVAIRLIKVYRMVTWIVIQMAAGLFKAIFIAKLQKLDVIPNGPKPWHPKIHDERFYARVTHSKVLGLGESYMDGWWDCERLDECIEKLVRGKLYPAMMTPLDYLSNYVQFQLFNLQTGKQSWEVAKTHYDIGNQLFESFLDPSMNYSCGYWKEAKNLAEAQQHKMELIGRKLKLEKGMKVLDIGCGWGGLCKFLAETYGVTMVGVTVAKEGAAYGSERCAGLPVDIRVQDYRELDPKEKFDRIVSVGMFEHVGERNYRTFMEVANRHLVDDGIFLLHTIGTDNDCVARVEPWVAQYIFPNSILPLHTDIPKAIHNIFTIEDWHNIGPSYDKTLMAWHENFVKNWSSIEHLFEDSKRFYRMWTFYLQIAAGIFRARKYHCWQIVLTKGTYGGYESVR